MRFAKFQVSQKSAPIGPMSKGPKPKKKALLVLVDHPSLITSIRAQKERYKREGYEVQTLFINVASLLKKTKNKDKNDTLFIQELQDNIAWLKASDKALLSVWHHGVSPDSKYKQEIPEHLKGAAIGALLGNHGLNEDFDKKMSIKYCACYGGRPDPSQNDTAPSDDFFNALHSYGAGGFIGNAMTEIVAILIDDPKKISAKSISDYLAPHEEQIKKVENEFDTSKSPPVSKHTNDPIPEQFLDTYKQAKQNIQFIEHNREQYQTTLKRGDSLIEIKVPEYPDLKNVFKLPTTKNPQTGNYEYKIFYLAHKKTQTSQVEKTSDPDKIAQFLNKTYPKTQKIDRKTLRKKRSQ